MIGTEELKAPSLFKLGACFIYEGLILIALSFLCVAVFLLLAGDATHGVRRYLLQLVLWLFIGVYFVWCWIKSGQTPALKTWKLKLTRNDGSLLSPQLAWLRYVMASLSLACFGLGFLWAIIDSERKYLHDRLLKTQINLIKPA